MRAFPDAGSPRSHSQQYAYLLKHRHILLKVCAGVPGRPCVRERCTLNSEHDCLWRKGSARALDLCTQKATLMFGGLCKEERRWKFVRPLVDSFSHSYHTTDLSRKSAKIVPTVSHSTNPSRADSPYRYNANFPIPSFLRLIHVLRDQFTMCCTCVQLLRSV